MRRNGVAPRDGYHCEERLITRYRVPSVMMNRTHSFDTRAAHLCPQLLPHSCPLVAKLTIFFFSFRRDTRRNRFAKLGFFKRFYI